MMMPDGEVLKGEYSIVRDGAVGFGSIIASAYGLGGHGYGACRSSKGAIYRLQYWLSMHAGRRWTDSAEGLRYMTASFLPPEELAVRRNRRLRREQRRAARDLARRRSAEALASLVEEKAPVWFTAEQVNAFTAELRRLYLRVAPLAHARGQRVG
jgi:hypothetical protein